MPRHVDAFNRFLTSIVGTVVDVTARSLLILSCSLWVVDSILGGGATDDKELCQEIQQRWCCEQ